MATGGAGIVGRAVVAASAAVPVVGVGVGARPRAGYRASGVSVQVSRPCSGGLELPLLPVSAAGETVGAALARLAAAPEPHAKKVSAAAEHKPASDRVTDALIGAALFMCSLDAVSDVA